jgi:hypothetical protein
MSVMNRLFNKRTRPVRSRRRGEEGAALVLSLVTLVVGAMVVGALATFVMTDYKAIPPIQDRTNQAEALKAATRMAINIQRESGPSGCAFASMQPLVDPVNDLTVTTTCSAGTPYMVNGGRFGLISTSNKVGSAHITGAVTPNFDKTISNEIFINSGRLSPGTSDLKPNRNISLSSYTSAATPANRYSTVAAPTATACNNPATAAALAASDLYKVDAATNYVHALVCQAQPWWAMVGQPDVNNVRTYPALPPIPKYHRPYGGMAKIGSCNVFYPGRYLADPASGSKPAFNALVLDAGKSYYFASGVYYFEVPVIVSAGAKVVVGRGPTSAKGCTTDALAGTAVGKPLVFDITGRGGTFIFGKNANLQVAGNNTSVIFNPRFASAATAGSDGVSIRTVATGVATTDIEIPQDQVLLPDGTKVNVTTHTVAVGSVAVKYERSTLTHDQAAISVTTGNSSKISIPGFVITPHARVIVQGSGTSPSVTLDGGLVASEFQFPLTGAPVQWAMGSVPNVGQNTFTFQSSITKDGVTVSSRAILDLDQTGQFAVSQWSVDI